jgi:transcriptional regulator with XRE-family HTH domain
MPKQPDPRFAQATGANLLAARKRSGLTQHELARRAGVHPETVAHLERGRQAMMADTLFMLSGALGIEPAVLLAGTPSWNPTEQRFESEEGSNEPGGSAGPSTNTCPYLVVEVPKNGSSNGLQPA